MDSKLHQMNSLCFLNLVVLHCMHWGKENICFYLLLGCHIAICSQGALCQEVSQSVQVIITPMNIMSIRYIIPLSYYVFHLQVCNVLSHSTDTLVKRAEHGLVFSTMLLEIATMMRHDTDDPHQVKFDMRTLFHV